MPSEISNYRDQLYESKNYNYAVINVNDADLEAFCNSFAFKRQTDADACHIENRYRNAVMFGEGHRKMVFWNVPKWNDEETSYATDIKRKYTEKYGLSMYHGIILLIRSPHEVNIHDVMDYDIPFIAAQLGDQVPIYLVFTNAEMNLKRVFNEEIGRKQTSITNLFIPQPLLTAAEFNGCAIGELINISSLAKATEKICKEFGGYGLLIKPSTYWLSTEWKNRAILDGYYVPQEVISMGYSNLLRQMLKDLVINSYISEDWDAEQLRKYMMLIHNAFDEMEKDSPTIKDTDIYRQYRGTRQWETRHKVLWYLMSGIGIGILGYLGYVYQDEIRDVFRRREEIDNDDIEHMIGK